MMPPVLDPASAAFPPPPWRAELQRREERRFLLLVGAAAALALACLLRPGMSLGNLFPRVSLVGALVALAVSLRLPRLALPALIVLFAPLYALGKTVGQVSVAGYPLNVLSLGVWGLGVYYALRWPPWRTAARGPSLLRAVRKGLLLIMLASVPALWMSPGRDNDPFITTLIFVAGTVEPLVLFFGVSAWLQHEQEAGLLVKALLLSCVAAVLVGQVNLAGIQYDAAGADSSALRFNLTGFGGANLTGFVLVSMYPLLLLLLDPRRLSWGWGLGAVGLLWGIAIFSLSRATPLILGVQTVVLVVGAPKERPRLLGMIGGVGVVVLLLAPIFPATYFDMWWERLGELNLPALYQKDYRQLASSDVQRLELQHRLVAEILQRPFGGYAATGQEDPEGLYLDTALQLGWLPAACLLALHLAMLGTAVRQWRRPEGVVGVSLFTGVLLYGLTTGVNLAKAGGDTTLQYGYGVNALPTLCNVIALALIAFLLSSKSEPHPSPAV